MGRRITDAALDRYVPEIREFYPIRKIILAYVTPVNINPRESDVFNMSREECRDIVFEYGEPLIDYRAQVDVATAYRVERIFLERERDISERDVLDQTFIGGIQEYSGRSLRDDVAESHTFNPSERHILCPPYRLDIDRFAVSPPVAGHEMGVDIDIGEQDVSYGTGIPNAKMYPAIRTVDHYVAEDIVLHIILVPPSDAYST